MKVPFFRHNLDENYASSVAQVLRSEYLTTGGVCRSVEDMLRRYFSVEEACLTNSWSNAMFASLLALDVGPGDEVILPAMTFVACANVVELTGARPVFVDVDTDTLLVDFEAIVRAITDRTRVVMPVQLYGQMCDMATLRNIVKRIRDDIVLIEDCAHSFESSYAGERPGKHSDIAIFSFYATKNITCGEGGAVITNDRSLMGKIRPALSHGVSAFAVDRFAEGIYRHWDVAHLGTKGNLPDLLAALLPRQIERVDEFRYVRLQHAKHYRSRLDPRLRFAHVSPQCVSAEHLFPIHVPAPCRDAFLVTLNKEGVGATINYRSIHRLTYYKKKYAIEDSELPVSSEWGDGEITLPLYLSLSPRQLDYVIETVNRIVKEFIG